VGGNFETEKIYKNSEDSKMVSCGFKENAGTDSVPVALVTEKALANQISA
jgi:hypothetical protein